ncbi:MAG: IclR family transcriptional regulator [Deltaproteobacteria bacterium]|nr:IclR family transcriptional regulator [Deltaproteobacteria bacterium]
MAASKGYRAPSVGRALQIMEMVSESNQGLGISDLSRRLNLSKGTVFGLCQQLEAGGGLIRDHETKKYVLGPLVDTLARRGQVLTRLRELAAPHLSRLCDLLDQSIFLGVMGREHVTVLDMRQPGGHVGISAGPGTHLPLTAGAVGRVFLAGMPPARVDLILAQGLPRYTPHTIIDPDHIRRLLDQVRRDGYAVEQEEYLTGVWGVAVSLGSGWGAPAGLWSVGFTSSLNDSRLHELATALADAARHICQDGIATPAQEPADRTKPKKRSGSINT